MVEAPVYRNDSAARAGKQTAPMERKTAAALATRRPVQGTRTQRPPLSWNFSSPSSRVTRLGLEGRV